jgi:hypothetical protein
MNITDWYDSSSISSSLSSDSSDHCRRSSNKKPRLETNDGVDVLVGTQIPRGLIALDSNVSAVSHRLLKPSAILHEIANEGKVIIHEPVATGKQDFSASMHLSDRSAFAGSPVHVISPVPSRLDLLVLQSPISKPASHVLSNEASNYKKTLLSNSESSEANEFVDEIPASGANVALPKWSNKGLRVIIFALVLLLTAKAISEFLVSPDVKVNSVYVTGGGFSGFWFTLGRLQGVRSDHAEPKQLYCYSSGCLALVAALSRYSMEEMWNIAHNVQNQWKYGHISRYDVVTIFVDDLLFGPDTSTMSLPGNISDSSEPRTLRLRSVDLASLNIITTVNDGWWRYKTSIRRPTSLSELRTMLIQTTWIPFAIGNELWHNGHMDGAFTSPFHPTTDVTVGLELDWDLYANVLNVNLGRDKVEKFWNKGIALGL